MVTMRGGSASTGWGRTFLCASPSLGGATNPCAPGFTTGTLP